MYFHYLTQKLLICINNIEKRLMKLLTILNDLNFNYIVLKYEYILRRGHLYVVGVWPYRCYPHLHIFDKKTPTTTTEHSYALVLTTQTPFIYQWLIPSENCPWFIMCITFLQNFTSFCNATQGWILCWRHYVNSIAV